MVVYSLMYLNHGHSVPIHQNVKQDYGRFSISVKKHGEEISETCTMNI